MDNGWGGIYLLKPVLEGVNQFVPGGGTFGVWALKDVESRLTHEFAKGAKQRVSFLPFSHCNPHS